MEDGIYIPELGKGSTVFHYTTALGMQGILSKEFWLTESRFLNDEKEFHVVLDVLRKVLWDALDDWCDVTDFYDGICEEYGIINSNGIENKNVALSGLYVLSLSLEQDNLALWTQTSDGHGYCLGFDLDTLLSNLCLKRFSSWHGKVIYDETEQCEALRRTLDVDSGHKTVFDYYEGLASIPHLTDDQRRELADYFAVVCSVYGMFFKHSSFRAESEYRIVVSAIHESKTKYVKNPDTVFFRIRDNAIIPYIKIAFKSLDCLNFVVIGPKNNNCLTLPGLGVFLRSLGVDPAVLQSSISLRY